jgi:hypothetical protein
VIDCVRISGVMPAVMTVDIRCVIDCVSVCGAMVIILFVTAFASGWTGNVTALCATAFGTV